MKKFSALFVLAAVFALIEVCLARPVWALSDADYKQMLKSSPQFAAADARLNKAWKALGAVTPKGVMSGYRDAQRRWNGTARDELVRQIVAVGEAREFYPEIDLKPALKNGAVRGYLSRPLDADISRRYCHSKASTRHDRLPFG